MTVIIVTVHAVAPLLVLKTPSANASLPKKIDFEGQKVTSGILKEPAEGRVVLRTLNPERDKQADLTVHGGSDKAVDAYSIKH